jgi:hypothetical protein
MVQTATFEKRHSGIVARTEQMSQKNNKCKHFLKAFCRKKSDCVFSHDIANCPNHYPTLSGGTLCQNTGCELRHPKICTHFIRAQCHFGTKCLLYHPQQESPTLPNSLMMQLQQSLEEMKLQLFNLKEEVRRLKEPKPTTSMMVQPTSVKEPKIPPDPPPVPATTLTTATVPEPMPEPEFPTMAEPKPEPVPETKQTRIFTWQEIFGESEQDSEEGDLNQSFYSARDEEIEGLWFTKERVYKEERKWRSRNDYS